MHKESDWHTEGTGVDYDELFWADKNPAEWIGREFVGERQLTIDIHGPTPLEYRVGLNERNELAIDRKTLDRFASSTERFSVAFEDAPESVRQLADELLERYVPEAARSRNGDRPDDPESDPAD